MGCRNGHHDHHRHAEDQHDEDDHHQVWFQNQRAKMKKMQRRNKTDKDGKPLEGKGEKKEKGDGESLPALA